MKVILLQDVKKQGKKDEIIDVSDGYAQNFLIKTGLAVPYTKTSKNILENELDKKAKDEQELINRCKEMKDKLEKTHFSFTFKSGKDGRLFGTVSTKQLSEELKKKGFDIDKKQIDLTNKIDSLGVYEIKLNLHKTVVAKIKVHIC